ncbi:glutathione S-transferase family protein [Paludibacterium yongneupense]|uniref:glutathione S-transferase family protein n=1 Tax=Paludibacterium yongneupense TaxID=400061 RepID=UPI00048D6AAB|nr:glutathione S-transferase [Paludibacterium yongneupense]
MLRILGRATSINVRKVLWTCAEIGIEHVREDWGRGYRSTREAEFLRLNPNGLIPVLVDGDFVLWESNAICRYLARSRGRDDLLPVDWRQGALVEQWMDWQAGTLGAAASYAFHALVRQSPDHRDEAQIASSLARWQEAMAILDAQLAATGAHAVGAAFTLADIVLGLSVHRWYQTPFDKPEFGAVRDYYQRLHARPGFVANGPQGAP